LSQPPKVESIRLVLRSHYVCEEGVIFQKRLEHRRVWIMYEWKDKVV